MRELTEPLIRRGLVDPGAVVGCSDDEIAELMRVQGVRSLPRSYRDFLSYTGRNPYWLAAEEWDYQWILEEGKATALELAAERRLDPAPFVDAFVFETHHGYMFCYFRSEDLTADDPRYYTFTEGPTPGGPTIKASDRTFAELLTALTGWMSEASLRR